MYGIKFRGLDRKRKEWVYGNFHYFGDQTYIIEPGKPGIPEQYIEVEPNSIGQYTGREDKNGKEIFRGDIVKSQRGHRTYLEKEIIGDVVYNKNLASFRIRTDNFGYGITGNSLVKTSAGLTPFDSIGESNTMKFTPANVYEVIGDIYKNLELL